MVKLEDVKKYEEYVIKMRREFHMYPETGFNETRTSARVLEELTGMGYECTTGIGVTGIMAVLIGNKDGKTIGLRADMDALAMQEENTFEYKSKNDGVMHSCGHDTHTAMLLGAAKYFSDNKDQVNGTLKLIFQAAEEGPLPGGGISVVNGGYIDDCDAVFGLHITTRDRTGTIVIKKGPAMAAPDEFKVKVTGTGTHASAPHTGIDPVLIAAEVITKFQSIVSRNTSATDSAVISVCTVHGGTAFNIIPESVDMSGTIRTLNNETRKHIFDRMHSICKHIGEMNNALVELEINKAYPPVINDPEMSEFVMEIGREVLGKENVIEAIEPSMGGEDFAYYLEKKPGSFFWLGGGKENDTAYNHNPLFNPEEESFMNGVAMHINIVKEYLK